MTYDNDNCVECGHSWHGLMCAVTKTKFDINTYITIREPCKCPSQFKEIEDA